VAGEGDGFHRDAFLHAAVAREAHDVMIEDHVLCRVEVRFGHLRGNGHADRIGDALAEWTSCGFDAARRVGQLGMARCLGAHLTEAFELGHRHFGVAAQVQPGIQEHRTMTGRQHEAIAVQPLRVVRAVAQRIAEQHRADLGAAQRQAEVPALTRVHSVDRETSSNGGGLGEYVFLKRHGARTYPKWRPLHALLTAQPFCKRFGETLTGYVQLCFANFAIVRAQ
jgi:hypothetical protein